MHHINPRSFVFFVPFVVKPFATWRLCLRLYQFHFARSAGDLLHVARDGITRESRAELFNDLTSHGDRYFKVRCAGNAIELMQVVRQDAQFKEPFA